MKQWLAARRFLLLALPLGFGGCAAPPPPAPTDLRLLIHPALNDLLQISPPNETRGSDGRVLATVELRNRGQTDVPIRHLTDWLTVEGRPVASLQSRPRFLTVPQFGVAVIEADAPNTTAQRFRIQIEPDMPDAGMAPAKE